MNKGQEEGLNKFICITEILYAVFMSWGFAKIAESFKLSTEYSIDWSYTLPSLIALFVLIRFFFAPVHNLRNIAIKTYDHYLRQVSLFLFDVPMLMFHSFIYYRMCSSISESNYAYFYNWFFGLLLLNIMWLVSIALRMTLWDDKEACGQHLIWVINNSFHYVILYYIPFIVFQINLYHTPIYLYLFCIALSNCIVDYLFAAPYYLGSKKTKVSIINWFMCNNPLASKRRDY